MLKVGAKAPAFRLESDEGRQIALKDFADQRVLLFFFPKASTPG
jgi:thioredoxin-dependent peroxiredoxin